MQYAEQGDLGKGAFGKVFKVTDKVSGKICACKRIPKQRPAESCVDGPPSAAQQARYIMGVYLEVDALRWVSLESD